MFPDYKQTTELDLNPQVVPLYRLESGEYRITGTRISLETVIYAIRDRESPDEIFHSYPTLSLPQIYALYAYYLQHRDLVDRYMAESREISEKLRLHCESQFDSHAWKAKLHKRREELIRQGKIFDSEAWAAASRRRS